MAFLTKFFCSWLCVRQYQKALSLNLQISLGSGNTTSFFGFFRPRGSNGISVLLLSMCVSPCIVDPFKPVFTFVSSTLIKISRAI